MTQRKVVLICDINIRAKGHYISYNNYLLHFIDSHNDKESIKFLFNSEAQNLLDLSKVNGENLDFVDIDPNWYNSFYGKFKIWNKIKSIADKKAIDLLLFMDFDQYQIPIGISKIKFKISGILFRPHHRIENSKYDLPNRFKFFIKKSKKQVLESILLHNSKINSIFILNDEMGVNLLNEKHHTDKFKYLPDPIFDYEFEEINSNLHIYINTTNRITFLIFGSISERKNISNILIAYSRSIFKLPTHILIIGPSSTEYGDYLSNLINDLDFDSQTKKVTNINKFISEGEKEIIHKLSNISLLIYKDFYGSSGLIGRAAKHQLPVVSSNVGLLNELVNKYGLGITVNPYSIEDISKALEKSAIEFANCSGMGFQSFYNDHSPEKFASTLLSTTQL